MGDITYITIDLIYVIYMGVYEPTNFKLRGLTIRRAPLELQAGLVQRRPRQGGGPLESRGASLRPSEGPDEMVVNMGDESPNFWV